MINRRSILLAAPALLIADKYALASVIVSGAGATFPAPLYFKWADEAKKAIGVQINYQSIGSGAGVNQIRNRTVTFGATDAPLQDPGDLFQFPTVGGKVVPIFNIPGVSDLNLTMPVIVKIYQGHINMWNDPQIASLNPNTTLPRLPIVPIYRADGSGTTYIWTKGMNESNAGWNDVGPSLRWPVGQGARGNEGIAATVQRVRGAIGYVEYIYSKNNNIPYAKGFEPPIGNTYILLPKEPKDRDAHNGAVRFFVWCFTNGLDIARSMDYYTFDSSKYETIMQQLKVV